jgi:hypothetical protein
MAADPDCRLTRLQDHQRAPRLVIGDEHDFTRPCGDRRDEREARRNGALLTRIPVVIRLLAFIVLILFTVLIMGIFIHIA